MRNEPLMVLSGIAIVLTAATLAASILGADDNLILRIKSWWVIVFVLGGAALAGRDALIVLFAAISFVALREFLALTVVQAVDRRAIVVSFTVILPVQYVLTGMGRYDWFVDFIPVFGLLLVPVLTALAGDSRNYLARTAELMTGLFVCVYCVSYVPALLTLRIAGHRDSPVLLMAFPILVTQASDVLQYAFGKIAGRHKVATRISPSKTVEGLIGGVAGATMLGASLWWMTPFTVIQAGIGALLIALTGFLSGLAMSAIKRDRGVKDWSPFIPGHGGVLDRLDSLCFSAPLFYHLTRTFFAS